MRTDMNSVTPPASVPPSAVRILDRVSNRLDVIARAAESDPKLQKLPPEIREREVPSIARRYLRLTVRALRNDEPLREEDMGAARDRATQLADDGVPLSLMVHNWHHGSRTFLEACAAVATSDDVDGLLHLYRAQFNLYEQILTDLIEAYQAEEEVLHQERFGAHHVLASLLINGRGADHEATRQGVHLASTYATLAISLGESGADNHDTTGRTITERRRIREINRVLARPGHPPYLSMLHSNGGQILLPGDGEGDAYDVAAALVSRIQSTCAAPVTAGLVDYAVPAQMPGSSALAQEILAIALADGKPAGVYRLPDVALTYQLTRPTTGSDDLAATLAPLDPYPELLETLRCYYAHDLDRIPTARALRVHPNTVNNRLHRIIELLGIDLNRVDSIMRLGAALKIRERRAQPAAGGVDPALDAGDTVKSSSTRRRASPG